MVVRRDHRQHGKTCPRPALCLLKVLRSGLEVVPA